MGCDIHLHVERKFFGDVWATLKAPHDLLHPDRQGRSGERYRAPGYYQWYLGRNYELFSSLADVRNDGGIDPLAMNPGIPDDASEVTQELNSYWGMDGHTPGWYDAHWLRDEAEWPKPLEEIDGEFKGMLDVLVKLGPPGTVRIVFWFDN